jgi:hypothetical protein
MNPSAVAEDFTHCAEGATLLAALDAALRVDGYRDVEGVKRLPGKIRAAPRMLTMACNSDHDLEAAPLSPIGLCSNFLRVPKGHFQFVT